jgi:hypothetical protein
MDAHARKIRTAVGAVNRKAAALALTRLETAVGLVDDEDPALSPDKAVSTVATAERTQGIADLHGAGRKLS